MKFLRTNRMTPVIVAVAVLAILTVAVRLGELDQTCSRALYHEGEWPWRNAPIWNFLYHYGTMPGLAAGLLALIALIMSCVRESWRKYSRVGLYLLLLLAIGPGLVTNAVLKEYWGRPRPAMVDQFGGDYPFEKVLTIDPNSPGKSFPCGHATMGFLFFGGYFIFRSRRSGLARFFLLLGLLLGSLIGVARMAQGGHFLSDVVWAGGIIWLCSWGLALVMGLPEKAFEQPPPRAGSRPAWMLPAIVLTTAALLFLFALATPYGEQQDWKASSQWGQAEKRRLVISAAAGTLRIQGGDPGLLITHNANGFGLPGSALKEKFSEVEREGHVMSASWRQRSSGLFSELEATTRVFVGGTGVLDADVTAEGKGELVITPPPQPRRQTWTVQATKREIVLNVPIGQRGVKKEGLYLIGPPSTPDRFSLKLESGTALFHPPQPAP